MINTDHVREIRIIQDDDSKLYQVVAYYAGTDESVPICGGNQTECSRLFKSLSITIEDSTTGFIRIGNL
jgi:hypothetical protein